VHEASLHRSPSSPPALGTSSPSPMTKCPCRQPGSTSSHRRFTETSLPPPLLVSAALLTHIFPIGRHLTPPHLHPSCRDPHQSSATAANHPPSTTEVVPSQESTASMPRLSDEPQTGSPCPEPPHVADGALLENLATFRPHVALRELSLWNNSLD
jgi:hypothetical protein